MQAIDHAILVECGADFEETFSLVDPDSGDPVDLSGCGACAQIRKTYSASEVIAEFDIAIDGPNGKITFSLDSEATDGIPIKKASNWERTLTRYIWDLELTWPDLKVERIAQGMASISPQATLSTPTMGGGGR